MVVRHCSDSSLSSDSFFASFHSLLARRWRDFADAVEVVVVVLVVVVVVVVAPAVGVAVW